MSNKLIIVLSSKDGGGKSTLAKLIYAEFLNKRIGKDRFSVNKQGRDIFIVDNFNNQKVINPEDHTDDIQHITNAYSVKTYSFEDTLKEFCINVFGIDRGQCYGSEDDQNTNTHVLWDDMPLNIREKYGKVKKGVKKHNPSSYMRAFEFIDVFGNDLCKKIDPNCWARGLYNKINKDDHDLSIVVDAKHPPEITLGSEIGGKIIRLTRGTEDNDPLEHFPLGEYSVVLQNHDMQIKDMWASAYPFITNWFNQYKI